MTPRVADLFAADAASTALGIEVLEAASGRARLRMTVRADMVQGHATCHGGLLFTLADSAFAAACNRAPAGPSWGRPPRSPGCRPLSPGTSWRPRRSSTRGTAATA